MDLQLAKSLATHGAIVGFDVYRITDTDKSDLWFFTVSTKNQEPTTFRTARRAEKHYKNAETLLNEIMEIIECHKAQGGSEIPVQVHL